MAIPTVQSVNASAPAALVHGNALAPDLHTPATTPDRADAWLVQAASSLAIPARVLAEFRALMTRHGFRIEMSRFFLDMVYAYRQLAIAHSLGHERLKVLALELFDACQQLDQRRRQLTDATVRH